MSHNIVTHEDSRYLISSNAAVCVYFVQWLFETQSDEYVLGQKTIEFEFLSGMLSLDYYALGYCISHSKCQWVLGLEEEIDETHLKMLALGAGTRSEPRGSRRVVGLREDLIFMNAEFTLTNLLNWCFTSWRDILHLRQLFLKQPVLCDSISWPDISALRVLELTVTSQTECKLNTLLLHLSLVVLTITLGAKVCGIAYEDCVAIADHITSTTSLRELCISSSYVGKMNTSIAYEKGVETITAALASNHSLPLERLELVCTFTATAGDSLAQFITNTTTLKYLSIKKCRVSATSTGQSYAS